MNSGDCFGPALPPDYGLPSPGRNSDCSDDQSVLKRKSQRQASESSTSDQSGELNISSSSLKKHKNSPSSDPIIMGPALPPGYVSRCSSESNSEIFIGPVIPSSAIEATLKFTIENDHDLVGPLLPGEDASIRSVSIIDQLEARAQHMKNKLLGKDSSDQASLVASRDTWMTELPPELSKNFGVTARKFTTKKSTGSQDRSGWTDTPADRARKEKQALDGTLVPEPTKVSSGADEFLLEVDASYRSEVDEYNKLARPKSLLEIHNDKLQGKSHQHSKKKRKKDKKESKDKKNKKKKHSSRDSDEDSGKNKKAKKIERKPFDREKDLELSKMDDSKRKAVIKRSHELGTRFGHGSLQFL